MISPWVAPLRARTFSLGQGLTVGWAACLVLPLSIRDATAQPGPVLTAELVATLSEQQTAGPLYRTRQIAAVADELWVLDSGNHRIVVLREGSADRVIGREGQGPGEFRFLSDVTRTRSGRIAIWDRSLRRLTTYGGAGDVVATDRVDISLPGLQPWSVHSLEDGYLALFNTSMRVDNLAPAGQEIRGVLLRLQSDGAIRDTVRTFPLSGALMAQWEEGEATVTSWFQPFSDTHALLRHSPACGGLFVSAKGRELDLAFISESGEIVGSHVDPGMRGVPVTRAEWEAYLNQPRRADRRTVARVAQRPDHHAAVQDLQVTANGYVLVRLTPANAQKTNALWRLWALERSPAGRVSLGRSVDLSLPRTFTPYELVRDELWGIFLDRFGEPFIQSYRLPAALPPSCGGSDR